MTREIGEALIACFDDAELLAAREVSTSPALGIAGAVSGRLDTAPPESRRRRTPMGAADFSSESACKNEK